MRNLFLKFIFLCVLVMGVSAEDKHLEELKAKYGDAYIIKVDTTNKQAASKTVKYKEVESVKTEDKTEINELYKDTRFFIGAWAGFSKFTIEEKDTGPEIDLDHYVKDAGLVYGAELGYYFSDTVFVTLNYQHTDLENVMFDNLFATLNYQFKMSSILPYLGVLGGYNIMDWKNYPVDTIITQENSSSFFIGGQVGAEIPLTDSLSANVFYRYMDIGNKTVIDISPSVKEIKHNVEQSLNIGLKYNF